MSPGELYENNIIIIGDLHINVARFSDPKIVVSDRQTDFLSFRYNNIICFNKSDALPV